MKSINLEKYSQLTLKRQNGHSYGKLSQISGSKL